jgi:hypothetical protein
LAVEEREMSVHEIACWLWRRLTVLTMAIACSTGSAWADSIARLVAAMDDPAAFTELEGNVQPVPDGVDGTTVLRAEGAFSGRIDLQRPEEIKEAGSYKGMETADPSLRGLRIAGFIAETHRLSQPPDRRIWLGPLRLVKKAVDLDWDQRRAPYS